jgi:predicted nucleic acid-binding protein
VEVIFDTSEFIRAERSKMRVEDILLQVPGAVDVYVSVITLAELKHGVRRADTPERALKRQQFLNEVMSAFIIVPVSTEIALRAGELDAELELQGEALDIADVIIAATALEHNLSLMTHNTRHFERITQLPLLAL